MCHVHEYMYIKFCGLFQLVENHDVRHLPSEETTPHVCRVGWSTDDNSMQLGKQSSYNLATHTIQIP